ncbi:hypothetical protein GGR27_001586 [Lewinella antarctica]|uniref:Uncharacterized protein n=1 Tax=Neolewinella antarctica TaxID=442734 RepID=A0ABX0XBD9_9BACT|nr:hypothetical protein [Neolewinella antarctica]
MNGASAQPYTDFVLLCFCGEIICETADLKHSFVLIEGSPHGEKRSMLKWVKNLAGGR